MQYSVTMQQVLKVRQKHTLTLEVEADTIEAAQSEAMAEAAKLPYDDWDLDDDDEEIQEEGEIEIISAIRT